jgi:hypothetical protein
MDSIGSGYGPMACFLEHNEEFSDVMKTENSLTSSGTVNYSRENL